MDPKNSHSNGTVQKLWNQRTEIVTILEEKWSLICKHYASICRYKILIDNGNKGLEASYKVSVEHYNKCTKEFNVLHHNLNEIEEKLRENGVSVDHVNNHYKSQNSDSDINLDDRNENGQNNDARKATKRTIKNQKSSSGSFTNENPDSSRKILAFQNISENYWKDIYDKERAEIAKMEQSKSQNTTSNAVIVTNQDGKQINYQSDTKTNQPNTKTDKNTRPTMTDNSSSINSQNNNRNTNTNNSSLRPDQNTSITSNINRNTPSGRLRIKSDVGSYGPSSPKSRSKPGIFMNSNLPENSYCFWVV